MPALRRLFASLTLFAALLLAATFPALAAAVPPSETGFLEPEGPDLPSGLAQKEALLTIFYDASTYGELHPCPT